MEFGVERTVPLAIPLSPNDANRGKSFGQGPARFVESIRLEAARNALEQGGRSLAEIARLCGFCDAQTLRRTFRKHLGVSPGDYRERFLKAAPG